MLKSLRTGLVVLATSLVVLTTLTALLAAAPPKEPGKVVDAGTYTITVDGKRVGTETFKIMDLGATNVTTSQIKITEGNKAEQASVLTMNPAGELVRYSWKELSPGKATNTVEVTEKAVMQHIVMPSEKKPIDIPYMTPASTMVLDDNVFAHRQLLAWRFLRSSCGKTDVKRDGLTKEEIAKLMSGGVGSTRTISIVEERGISFDADAAYLQTLKAAGASDDVTKAIYAASMKPKKTTFSCAPLKLGVLVPAQHVLAVISVDYVGSEKLQYKGVEREVDHLKLTSDDLEWNIWVDPADSYKVLRINIPANKTEVLRD